VDLLVSKLCFQIHLVPRYSKVDLAKKLHQSKERELSEMQLMMLEESATVITNMKAELQRWGCTS
jgi:hypothetical protein